MKTTAIEEIVKAAKKRYKDQKTHAIGTLTPTKRPVVRAFPVRQYTPAAAPAKAKRLAVDAADGTELWGVVISKNSWAGLDDYSKPFAIVSTTAGSGSLNTLHEDTWTLNINAGGAFYDGKFHGLNAYEYDGKISYVNYYEFNTSTWEHTDKSYGYSYDSTIVASATAYDPTSGKVYAFLRGRNDGRANFGTVDYDALTSAPIAVADRPYVALAANAEGQLYAIGLDGGLYTIDKASGQSAKVGSTGVVPAQVQQSAAFDLNTGNLYWAAVEAGNTSALYRIDTATGAASKLNDFSDGEEIVCLYVPAIANPKAPSPATNLSATFDGGSLAGKISFDVPSANVDGTPLDGQVEYFVVEKSDTLAKGTAQPGSHVSEDVTVGTAGQHALSVILRNRHGDSNKATVTTSWVGNDVPLSPDNITLSIDGSRRATLTWSPTDKGFNGGFIDQANVTYDVTRQPGGTVVAQGIKETHFEETLPEGTYQAYYYTVMAYNDGTPAEWASSSNKVKFGSAFTVPYFEDFNEVEDINLFEIIDGNGDGRSWTYAYGNVSSRSELHGSIAHDDWLITPPIKLLDRRAYYFRFKVRGGDDATVQRIAASIGTGTNPDDYSEIVAPSEFHGMSYTPFEQLVRIDHAADYRFGLRDVSTENGLEVLLDSIEVVAGPLYSAPDSVANLAVTPAARGALSATVSFNAPSKTFEGNKLGSIVRIETERDGRLISTIDNPQPGQPLTVEDEGAGLANGFHTYTVTAFNADGLGLKRSATAYIGIDTPLPPSSITIADNLDGSATMAWKAPTKGANGAFIDPQALTYKVYGVADDELTPVGESASTSFRIDDLPQPEQQGVVAYAVSAISAAGEGTSGLGTIIVGKPYTVPFHEGFAEGNPENPFWLSTTTGNGTFGTYNSMSSDGDGGCVGFIPGAETDSAATTTGKIFLGSQGHPKLTFDYYALPGTKAALTVRVAKNGSPESTAARTIDYRTTGREGWQKAVIDLDPFNDHAGYINISFCGRVSDGQTPVILDNINIDEIPAHGVAVSLKAPKRINVGADGEFVVGLDNVGSNDANGVEVALLVNGKAADTQAIDLPAYASKELKMHFRPTPATADSIVVEAEARYAQDLDMGDNKTAPAKVAIVRPVYPVVSDLQATSDGDGRAALSWTAPDLKDGWLTDGFDTYTAFSVANVGNWTMVDGDQSKTTSISGASSWPNSMSPFAYVVFNPSDAGLDLGDPSLSSYYKPRSGSQYMAAFACDPRTAPLGHNDDWLISPELSGKAQTVSFFGKSVFADWDVEKYEVLYSTASSDTADFVPLLEGELPDTWTEVKADLPAGARYFAIRCVSSNQFVMMVDDVTYQGVVPVVKGYNIYRDNQLAASVDASTLAWTDTEAPAGRHVYNVTVVYADGESAMSNSAETTTTAISAATAGALNVVPGRGTIKISNALGSRALVYAADGRLAATVDGKAEATVNVPRGQYLVKVGRMVFNVVVR